MTSEAPMTDTFARGASQPVASPPSLPPTQSAALEFEEDDADITALPPRRRVPALTKLLFVAILGTLAFGGGVLVQKQHDASLTASPASLASLFAGGLPAGGGGGLGAGPTASGSPTGGTGSTGVVPVLIGTVESVNGSDLTVKDLGGTSHVVHATATTTISVASADWSASLKVGATVSIQGSKAADGSVTATAVTQR
jgi:Domain of unknown function (DUF5666)